MDARRPALEILRDVRAHGAELKGDVASGTLSIIGPIPPWLAREVKQRSLDIRALCEEFDVPGRRAVFAAEGLLRHVASRARNARSR